MLANKENIEEYRLTEAFDLLDVDNSGFITKENLRDILGREYAEELVDRLIKEVDIDKDGKISFDDFLVSLQGLTREKLNAIVDEDEPCSSSLDRLHKINYLIPEKVIEHYRRIKLNDDYTTGVATLKRIV